jgi:hypothetical protein
VACSQPQKKLFELYVIYLSSVKKDERFVMNHVSSIHEYVTTGFLPGKPLLQLASTLASKNWAIVTLSGC